MHNESPAPRGLRPEALARVLALVDDHLGEPLLISRLAGAAGMSPFHFARLFKLSTGQPPHAYVVQRRVERAKSLLAEGAMPLLRVANSVGFQTQGHFTGVFRRYAGVTPRRYRIASRAASRATATGNVESAPATL